MVYFLDPSTFIIYCFYFTYSFYQICLVQRTHQSIHVSVNELIKSSWELSKIPNQFNWLLALGHSFHLYEAQFLGLPNGNWYKTPASSKPPGIIRFLFLQEAEWQYCTPVKEGRASFSREWWTGGRKKRQAPQRAGTKIYHFSVAEANAIFRQRDVQSWFLVFLLFLILVKRLHGLKSSWHIGSKD